jgi:hypothetical protein
MNEQKFKSEMRRAEIMRRAATNDGWEEYWVGYIRGLRRAYHGKKFGTEEEHIKWLAPSEIKHRQSRSIGYSDGLAYGKISAKIGRPSIGDQPMKSIGVRLPVDQINRIPKPRAEWIRNIILQNLPE